MCPWGWLGAGPQGRVGWGSGGVWSPFCLHPSEGSLPGSREAPVYFGVRHLGSLPYLKLWFSEDGPQGSHLVEALQ